MKIVKEDFDSEKFAEFAQSEARKFLPEGMSELDKNFILDNKEGHSDITSKWLSFYISIVNSI